MSYFYQALVKLHVAPTEELAFLWWDDQEYWESHETGLSERIQTFVDAIRLAVLEDNIGPDAGMRVTIQHQHVPRDMAGNPAALGLSYSFADPGGNMQVIHRRAIGVSDLFENRYDTVGAVIEEDRRRIRIAVLKFGTEFANV